MAIALERERARARTARSYRARRGVGLILTWVALIAALVFFLGPFVWIVTTHRSRRRRYLERLDRYEFVRLRSQREIEAWLAERVS